MLSPAQAMLVTTTADMEQTLQAEEGRKVLRLV
jgi:hypothetical protein